jgi:hypothetical protein
VVIIRRAFESFMTEKIAVLLLSVAPEVKTISSVSAPIKSATFCRASWSAAFALRPML